MKEIQLSILFLLIGFIVFAQGEKKHIRSGNKEFEKEKFDNSEVSYRKALEKEQESFDAAFNLGDALYKQEKYEESARQFQNLAAKETGKENLSKVYHNLGNSFLQSQKLQESIDAYKQALRNNPTDMETKYNLAFAQKKLKEQEQQDQEQQDQENKDQEDQEKKDQKDQEKQNQDQKDQQEKEQKQQDKQDQQQQKPEENKISKEDAQRMLEALQNDERELLEKIKKQKAKAQRYAIEKDW